MTIRSVGVILLMSHHIVYSKILACNTTKELYQLHKGILKLYG